MEIQATRARQAMFRIDEPTNAFVPDSWAVWFLIHIPRYRFDPELV